MGETQTTSLRDRWSPIALLVTSFVGSAAFGEMFVALPYFARALSCTPGQVGWLGGVYTVCYAGATLLAGHSMDRFSPRTLTVISSFALLACAALMGFSGSAAQLFGVVALYGVCTVWMWPPLMGWISRGLEGAALNRRLGWFNAAWSSGLIVGPLMGGLLYSLWPPAAFLAAAGCHLACACILLSAIAPHRATAPTAVLPRTEQPASDAGAQMIRFRRLARIGLFAGYLVIGLLRYQLPGVAQSLGLDAARYAPISTTLSATQAVGFALLGATHAWHFRRPWLWAMQALLGGVLLVVASTRSEAGLYLVCALAGLGVSFLYASHLYYGVSGGSDRARLMAIHEILLSAGFLTGSVGGGVLSDAVGLRAPYWVGAALLGASIVLSMVVSAERIRSRGGADGERAASLAADPPRA